jgi:hypothetical protein
MSKTNIFLSHSLVRYNKRQTVYFPLSHLNTYFICYFFCTPRVGCLEFYCFYNKFQFNALFSSSIAQPIFMVIDRLLIGFHLFWQHPRAPLNSCEESIGRAFTFIDLYKCVSFAEFLSLFNKVSH